MIKKKIFFFIFFFLILNNLLKAENKYKILASVNQQSITQIDLINEMKLLEIINKNKNINTNEVKKIAFNNLIDEKIKIEEIINEKIKYDNNQINEYYQLFINNNEIKNINPLYEKLLKQKIKIDFQWNRLIVNNFYWKINVNVKEIEKKIIQESNDKQENKQELEKKRKKYIEIEKEKKLKVYSNYYLKRLKNKALIKYF